MIIAKHRKGATGIVRMDFKGEFTRFENPEDKNLEPNEGGEIRGSGVNGKNNMPFPREGYDPFNVPIKNDY